ncbi:hypothetical protein [Microtetraspora glauca]|uniref:Uncharacterized protein n=1 Tax=Microtetraspora glauca TaxID=1996 RepID=A0ABV3GI81_MICGL
MTGDRLSAVYGHASDGAEEPHTYVLVQPDIDGSPHTMNARATIAATPMIIADLVELVAGAEKDADHPV